MNVMTHPNASSSSSLRAVTPTEKQRPRGKDRRNPEADEEPALTVGGEPEHHGEQEREAGGNEEEGLRGAERSDFVVPWFQGKPFFAKPILSYWLMAAAFEALGPSAGAVSSSAVRTASETKSTCASRSSPACCRRYEPPTLYGSLRSFHPLGNAKSLSSYVPVDLFFLRLFGNSQDKSRVDYHSVTSLSGSP